MTIANANTTTLPVTITSGSLNHEIPVPDGVVVGVGPVTDVVVVGVEAVTDRVLVGAGAVTDGIVVGVREGGGAANEMGTYFDQ